MLKAVESEGIARLSSLAGKQGSLLENADCALWFYTNRVNKYYFSTFSCPYTRSSKRIMMGIVLVFQDYRLQCLF